ncbi:DUF4296 domain-containing protein [Marinigracilibium pacificum]|uniref:DUF4296 domain-containing protein n=1 Tax=Marinigracilibium pacificum TaxID=2729599 RepID=A0A848IVT6_9BACT|nr:DUF4296 domain-containing protein [Marinigracilibium pacificum]NMM48603.1 DUF4296 domain-containing protein [Marinigracilibium pacificum]
MKVSYILMTLSVLAFISCSEKENKKPDNLIDREKMISIQKELYLLDSEVNYVTGSVDSQRVVFEIYQDSIFEKFEVDSMTYFTSYQWYLENPDELKEVTNAVIDSLTLEEQKLE